jgi:hypothetical protein
MLGWLGSGTSSDMVDSSSSALCIPGEEEEAAAIFNRSPFFSFKKRNIVLSAIPVGSTLHTPTHAKKRHSFALETSRYMR